MANATSYDHFNYKRTLGQGLSSQYQYNYFNRLEIQHTYMNKIDNRPLKIWSVVYNRPMYAKV